MKSHLWQTIFLIGCLFLSACHGRKNQIHVVTRNFETEIEQQQNLVFSFNKDIYPDSLLQRWDSTTYIEFVPKVRGLFKWNSSSELVFSPTDGFSPGTEYTARLTRQLVRKSKRKFPVDGEKIKFHTAPLRVMASHLSWTRGKSMANVVVQLDVDFNYEVSAAEAASHIRIAAGGNNLLTTTINGGVGKTVTMQFMPVNELDQETPVNIEVTKDIHIARTGIVMPKDTVIKTAIPSRYNLSVTGIEAQHTGTEGIITLHTSQPVMEEGLKERIQIEPQVDFDVSLSDDGFVITSTALRAEQSYEVTVGASLEGMFGGRMKKEYYEQVSFGKLEPTIQFTSSKGIYLSSRGYKNLSLNIVNVPKVEVSVIKVYENNLEQFFRRGQDNGYDYDDEDSHWYNYYNTEDVGDTVFRKTYETSKLPKLNAARILHLDFQDKIKGYNGVYIITVASKDHQWVQHSKILSLSDIGLIVKQEKNNVFVYANSIRNATALADVKVSFISSNNQEMYTATTNGDGVAVFPDVDKKAPGFRLGMVTAKMNDEFSFVWLQQSQTETSRFDVGGRMPNDANLNAMVYAERDLYRPGETMHVSTIVRNEQWNTPGEMPVKMRLVMPNGKEFATMRKILDEEGSAETAFNIPRTALTGVYTLQVFTGNDVLLNDYSISVEEFIPDRLKAQLKIDKKEYAVGDSVKAFVQADNLFGTPAAGRNFETEMNVTKSDFMVKELPEYNFRIENDFNFDSQFSSDKTSEQGGGQSIFGIREGMRNAGMLKGNVMATVFDETGRPVHRYEQFVVFTQPVFVGIKNMDDYVQTRRPLRMGMIAVDKNGKVLSNVPVQLTIIKREWHTVIQQDGNSFRYVSQKEEKVMRQQILNVSGANFNFIYTPELSGEYELRVAAKGSNSYVSEHFYAWGWGDTQYTSFEVDNEGNVDITTDKEKYNAGDDVSVLFTTPFEGRMLVTLERDRVIKHFYLNTANKSASLKFKAEDFCVPNVYVTATLIRPMDGSDMPLTVAHGIKSVEVEQIRNHLPVKVTLVPKSRSKTKQTLTVQTTPGAYVTIAAVDEGILQIKNYKTPDPYKYFYQKVALATQSYDIYPLLLPEIKYTRTSTGGDGSDQSEMRVNPMFVNRVKNVSFWSGIVQANSSGIVKYDIDIPQFSGDIRVMAVAYKGKGFGGADQHMKVADPVVVSTALPRFLSPKDQVVVPVTLSNTTATDINANVNVQVQGPLSVVGSPAQQVTIKANKEGRVVFNIGAQQNIGAGKVTVVVKTGREQFVNETEIGVRPPASLQKQFSSGLAKENTTTTMNIPSSFILGTLRGKLIVNKSPLVQFTKNLSNLVNYPYGCVEQTTSAAFPQLYYQDLVRSMTGGENTDPNPAYNVQQAIAKLQSMQLSNGSLSYWPGGTYESWWGSIYAAHFLVEAKKAGYDVNAATLDKLLQYMKYRLNRRETELYYYNDNQRREIAAKEIPYSLYVLAIAGQPQLSTMNYYKAHQDVLALDSKYLLAAAYAVSGQPAVARQVLPPAFSGERSSKTFGGSFYSYVRDEAISLNALLDTDPGNSQVGIMARHLAEQMKKEYYLNTQENAWSFLAFGKIARASNKVNAAATVTVDGKPVSSVNGAVDMRSYAGRRVDVQVKGNGPMYYFWEVSGISATGEIKQEDSYMKVRRSYFDRSGNEITTGTFTQNDLVVVRITIEGLYSNIISNVAITDMLPAGFEIENTRLAEMPEIKWIKDEATADYMDIRDDRINLFTEVTGAKKSFYYMVRAVSPGTYTLGPVQADAMYNGEYHSYNGAGSVKVLQ